MEVVAETSSRYVFPFSAFVGQDLFKLSLILLAINPRIGGLLVMGEKGTGKSVLVRALADLLPPIKVVKGCPFNDDPDDRVNMCDVCREKLSRGEGLEFEYKRMEVVTLPLSASIDAVVGTIDIEKVLREGLRAFQPGILARANRQILYIDEVNLLPDHIIDSILDAAALGWNYVEREGVSVSHPSRFILVGTMNPEEGELRPQLLDRFAISVKVTSVKDKDLRVEIIKRNVEFVENPLEFVKKWEGEQERLREKIKRAKELLPKVEIEDRLLYIIAELCNELKVDGHRPDIIITLTAKTIAAYNERAYVTDDDVLLASKLALGHRTRNGGLLEPATYAEIEATFKGVAKKVNKFFR